MPVTVAEKVPVSFSVISPGSAIVTVGSITVILHHFKVELCPCTHIPTFVLPAPTAVTRPASSIIAMVGSFVPYNRRALLGKYESIDKTLY